VVDWGLRAVERAVGLVTATAAAAAAAAAAEVWVEAEAVAEGEEEASVGEEQEVVVYCTPRLARHVPPLPPVAPRGHDEIRSPFVATVHARLLAISRELVAAWRQRACTDLLLRCVWRWVACCAASVRARGGALAAASALLGRHGRVVAWRRWLTRLQQLRRSRQCGEQLHARCALRLWRRAAARPRTMRAVMRQRGERAVRAALRKLLAVARLGLVAAGRLRASPEPLRRAWYAWARPVRWRRRAYAAVVAMGYRCRGAAVVAAVAAWRRHVRCAAREAAAWRAAMAMATRVACASALLRWQQQPRRSRRARPYLLAARHYAAAGDRHAVGRAFRVWVGGAAAVNLWLRAAVARWARSQSRAIARWAAWAARCRRVMACAVRWRGAAAVKALRCWREAASSLSSAAAVMEVCAAAAAHAALALAWAELWRRARRALRAEAGWRAHVGRRALRRWRAAAATLPIALRKRSGAVRNNAANAMRSDPATAKRRWAAREAARAMLTWRAWTREGRALALACARRAYARGYARHSPMKGVAGGPLPERRKEILLARRSIATN